jgi:uncharacterized protein (DUF4415 family)
MTVKNTKPHSKIIQFAHLDDMPSAPPLSKAVKNMSDAEAQKRALNDQDAGLIPDTIWDKAKIIMPDSTEQITLRLPRHVLQHFKASGKGYQSRMSAVLSSYVRYIALKENN